MKHMEKMSAFQKKSLLAAVLLMIAYGFTNNTLGYFILPVTESLGCSRAAFNLYFTIMSLVTFGVTPFYGYLLQNDREKWILTAGAILGSTSFLIFSCAKNIEVFYIAAGLIGLVQGGATSMPAVVLISRAFHEKSGLATGITMTGNSICNGIMSLILPLLIERTGWENGYLLQAALWGIMLLAALILAKDRKAETVQKDIGSPERPAVSPLEKKAYCKRIIVVFNACVVVLSMFMVFLQHMPAFFTEMGASARQAGFIMSFFSIFLIVCKISLGAMFDRLGAVKTTWISLASFAVSFWIMLHGGMIFLCIGSLFTAFGMASITVLLPLITKYTFGAENFTSAWSSVSMAMIFGTAMGSPAWGLVYDGMKSYKPAVLRVPVLVLFITALLVFVMKNGKKD